MKKLLTSIAIIALGLAVTQSALATSGKSVMIVNNNQSPVTITYSSCDSEGTFCEFTKTAKLDAGEKLLIK